LRSAAKTDHGVRVIGRATVDGVEVLVAGGEHLAVVAETLRLRPAFVGLLGVHVVHVAQRDDLEAGAVAALQLPAANAADPDPGQRYPVAGRQLPGTAQDVTRNDGHRRGGGDAAEQLPAGETCMVGGRNTVRSRT
jgi:hypothetical protein